MMMEFLNLTPTETPPRAGENAMFVAGAKAMREAMLKVAQEHVNSRIFAQGEGEYYLGAEHAAVSLYEDLVEVPVPGEKK
jgi:hypothetical protein